MPFALPQLTSSAVKHPNEDVREVGMQLFVTLVETLGRAMTPYLLPLQPMFKTCLEDPSHKVRRRYSL